MSDRQYLFLLVVLFGIVALLLLLLIQVEDLDTVLHLIDVAC